MGDEDNVLGDWVLATYHAYHCVHVHFVLRKNGKPALHYSETPYVHDAYRWNSYHAAAKFKRQNKSCRGYVIVNLKDIFEQCRRQYDITQAETVEDREELRRKFRDDR